jgi:hypothetical protein
MVAVAGRGGPGISPHRRSRGRIRAGDIRGWRSRWRGRRGTSGAAEYTLTKEQGVGHQGKWTGSIFGCAPRRPTGAFPV